MNYHMHSNQCSPGYSLRHYAFLSGVFRALRFSFKYSFEIASDIIKHIGNFN